MNPAEYLAYLCSRLEVSDNEIEHKETELKATLRELREKPEDAVLLAERDRLVEALAVLNARRRNLEDKLPGVGTIGGEWGYAQRVAAGHDTPQLKGWLLDSGGDAGAAAGLDVGSAARAGPSASQGAETAVGAGSLPAAPGQSLGGTADAGYFADILSSALYGMTFTLYDGVDVAMRLVSHARANGFRGEVRHVSTLRSDFTLLLDTDDEASKQTFKRFVKWLATQLLDMYNQGPLTVYATTEVPTATTPAVLHG
eukprot:XP_001700140.1 predicted protein [Chlamydomonas reinhardtii]